MEFSLKILAFVVFVFGSIYFFFGRINLTDRRRRKQFGIIMFISILILSYYSLNNSFVQFGFAAGAAIGGIVVGGLSVMAITWIGAASVVFAAIVAAVSFGRSHTVSNAR